MKARLVDHLATFFFWLGAGIILVLLGALVGYLLFKGCKWIDLDFITRAPENLKAGGGVGPQLFNSFYLLVLSMLFTVPLGVGAGIYLAEYAGNGDVNPALALPRSKRASNFLLAALNLSIETLASLPSIVVGLFGLLIFVVSTGWGYSLMAGALALTVLNLPVMVRISLEALHAVPRDLKEASLALGASRWETIWKVVLPAAFPGLVTGGIITAGRVFGEAAALLYTAGMSSPVLDFSDWNPLHPNSPLNPFRPAATLAVHIWKINSEGLIPDVRRVADGSAALLIIVVLVFNLLARWLGSVLYRRMTAS
ncbi:MAG: phosphate transport system permease protein [Moorella sp. (in: firmicutes)]|uniref:Phosphate transport system permease protein PstA n=1 Tax=Neomoorella thermoacetica TaxID=1525 RepID=A0A1J5NKX4_NEOTH|nr:phosphate transport system permease protein [Moorella sp. (in: firmicutes)]OIQ59262.1 phosphate transport system permease protein PstA [Moorella thermoacetica]